MLGFALLGFDGESKEECDHPSMTVPTISHLHAEPLPFSLPLDLLHVF